MKEDNHRRRIKLKVRILTINTLSSICCNVALERQELVKHRKCLDLKFPPCNRLNDTCTLPPQ